MIFCLINLLNSMELVYQGLILVWIACSETILQNKAPLFKQYKSALISFHIFCL